MVGRMGGGLHFLVEIKLEMAKMPAFTNLKHCGKCGFNCYFSDSECSWSFFEQGKLDMHMRRHTGEKPFSCQQCNLTFKRADSLKVMPPWLFPSTALPGHLFSTSLLLSGVLNPISLYVNPTN